MAQDSFAGKLQELYQADELSASLAVPVCLDAVEHERVPSALEIPEPEFHDAPSLRRSEIFREIHRQYYAPQEVTRQA